jgi:hypothetical protein
MINEKEGCAALLSTDVTKALGGHNLIIISAYDIISPRGGEGRVNANPSDFSPVR